MRQKKAQSSVEYIIIVSLALLIIIPSSFVFINYVNSSKVTVLHSHVFNIGNNLVDSATKVYSIGDNSWQTIEISIPEEVQHIKLYNSSSYSEVVINYGLESYSDGVFFSDIKLCNETTCDCTNGCTLDYHVGVNKIRVVSVDGKVHFRIVQ